MKTLKTYILESDSEKTPKPSKQRGKIKFTIWESPDKKVNWIKNNQTYQKIEYKHEDPEKHIEIDFLLGYQDDSWKLWAGKIGCVSYDDDPYCSFDTDDFKIAIIDALDKVEEFIKDVEDNPQNWIQFYEN